MHARRLSLFTLFAIGITLSFDRSSAASSRRPGADGVLTLSQSNEQNAIASLRLILAAQRTLQVKRIIDSDADGHGEYGYFGELAGTAALRFYDAAADAPGIGPDKLDPPLLPAAFGHVLPDGSGDGVVQFRGYHFKLFLPDVSLPDWRVAAIPEFQSGGADPAALPSEDNGALYWCCYAWPVEAGVTGTRVYFVNQEGVLLRTANRSGAYQGLLDVPPFDAAYSNETGGDDMAAPLGITAKIEPKGFAANDGNVWKVVRAPSPDE